MLENIRLLRLNLRDFYYDILELLIVGVITNFISFHLVAFIKSKSSLPSNYDYFPLSIAFINIAIWIITYLALRKYFLLRVRPLISSLLGNRILENRFSLDLSRFDKEWEFQGNVKVIDENLVISNSPSGCLIKNGKWDTKLWKDFAATLNISFESHYSLENDYLGYSNYLYIVHHLKSKKVEFRKILGIIFRAQNLDDHFMLGVMIVGNSLVFRPHVRVSGNLDIPLHNSPESTYNFGRKIHQLQIKMLVKGNEVKVFVKQGRRWNKCYYWLLPTFYKTNLNETQSEPDSSGIITREIPFKNDPGKFGFRNYGNEISFINALQINGRFSKEENNLFRQ